MDKIKINDSKSISAITSNKNNRKSLNNNKDNETIPKTVIKKRGVYVEKYLENDGIIIKDMEEIHGSNKNLIESALSSILGKSTKATQWPDERNRKKNMKFKNKQNMRKDFEVKERRPVELKQNAGVNKAGIRALYAAEKPSAKPKNPPKKTAPAKLKVVDKTATIKSKITVNSKSAIRMAPVKSITESETEQTINKFVHGRVKGFLLRKASPDNTLISDEIIRETADENFNDIKTESRDELDTMYDAKIYNLIEDFLEISINNCSNSLCDTSDSFLHIDEVTKELKIPNDNDEKSIHSFSNCPDTEKSSITTIRKHIDNINSMMFEKLQGDRKVSAQCMTDLKMEEIIIKKCSKNITKPNITTIKTNTLEHPKQRMQKKSTPVPKFANKSGYIVQHLYNIQLDSQKSKTKKVEFEHNMKKSPVFQKPQNFFDTLLFMLKNKNKEEHFNNNKILKFQNLKKTAKGQKIK